MVAAGFPATSDVKIKKYDISFKYKPYVDGKSTSQKVYSSANLDEVLPCKM
jgi:hypothetical protein